MAQFFSLKQIKKKRESVFLALTLTVTLTLYHLKKKEKKRGSVFLGPDLNPNPDPNHLSTGYFEEPIHYTV